MNVNTQIENTTGKLQGANVNFNFEATSKGNDGFGGGIFIRPTKVYDFYMSQIDRRYVQLPEYYEAWMFFSSNYNKKFALDFNPWGGTTSELGRNSYGFNISPRYRFSNKVSMILGYDYSKEANTIGIYDNDDITNIIFEKRNVTTSTLSLRSKIAINNKMTININSRYYWSYVESKDFKKLEDDGDLSYTNYTDLGSQDFSSWNLDCSYSWWIAPGSQLNVLYRNNSANFNGGLSRIDKDFSRNFNSLWGDNLNHTFSVSLRYFLDFNRVKNWI